MKLGQYEQRLIDIAQEIGYYLEKSGAKREDSQDIAQDVLVKLLEADIVLPFDKMRSWLYRSAVRLYIDRYRREKTYFDILQREFFFRGQLSKFDHIDYAPIHEEVARLPDNYRLVIDCYYFQDFSVKDTASLLNWSQSKVKVTLMRARQALKKNLEKAGYTNEDFNEF